MFLSFSLLLLTEQSYLPCVDTMAHFHCHKSTTRNRLCWTEALQQKIRQVPPQDYFFPVPRPGSSTSKIEEWGYWLVMEDTERNQMEQAVRVGTQRLV